MDVGRPALRRRLSDLLVGLTAARELQRGSIECSPNIVTATQCRVLAAAGEFVAEVLGPRLLVTTDNPSATACCRWSGGRIADRAGRCGRQRWPSTSPGA